MKKPQLVEDKKATAKLKARHDAVQKDIENLPKEGRNWVKSAQAEVEAEIAKVNDLVFDFGHEERIRKSGMMPSEAEELAAMVKTKQIGEIFQFKNQLKVLTPFKTVVDAQTYLYLTQNRLIEMVGEHDKFKTSYLEFTKMTSLDLIKLSFKRLLSRGSK